MPLTTCASGSAHWQDDRLLWIPRALCGLALPATASPDLHWSREFGGHAVLMSADPPGLAEDPQPPKAQSLPGGSALRLFLLHVFSTALRTGNTAVEVGPDPAAVAERLGIGMTHAEVDELAQEATRLLGAKLRIAQSGRGPVSVFDARKHGSRKQAVSWRPVVHLTQRFFASLQAEAIAVDRGVVATLARSTAALDAYAWLTSIRSTANSDHEATTPWAELQARFGHGVTIKPGPFRTAFTRGLEKVRLADATLSFAVGPKGVTLSDRYRAAAAEPNGFAGQEVLERDGAAPELPSGAAIMLDEEDVRHEERSGLEHTIDHSARTALERPEEKPARLQHDAARAQVGGLLRLSSAVTGLPLSVWLRRGVGQGSATIEVTPGKDYHSDRRAVFIIEPVVMQAVGGMHSMEVALLETWATSNSGVIQDYWEGAIAEASDVMNRVTPVGKSRW